VTHIWSEQWGLGLKEKTLRDWVAHINKTKNIRKRGDLSGWCKYLDIGEYLGMGNVINIYVNSGE
jgi:hypothetical protein